MNAPINGAGGYTRTGKRVEGAPRLLCVGFPRRLHVRLPRCFLRPWGRPSLSPALGCIYLKKWQLPVYRYKQHAQGSRHMQMADLSSTELCGKSCLAGFCRVHLMRLRKGSLTRPCRGCGVGAYNKQGSAKGVRASGRY